MPSYPAIQASPKRLCQLPTQRKSKKTWKKHSETLQTALLGVFTDEIMEHQDLGIYTLPGMEKTQAWFMRSGGIVEELQNQANPSGRIEEGATSRWIGVGNMPRRARRKDQVLMESEMSPGAWWAAFGPADSENQPSQAGYAGYELFVKHDDPILDQAHAYQEELDVLRTSAQNEQAYDASLKRAIAMRSSIEQEMLALFGGERIAQATTEEEETNRSQSRAGQCGSCQNHNCTARAGDECP